MNERMLRRFAGATAGTVALAAAAGAARGDVFTNVPSSELSGYQLVYDLNIPNAATFNGATVPYTADNHAAITTPWNRVAYYMELTDASNNTTYAYASMDPYGAGIRRIGIPNSFATGAGTFIPAYQTNVSNLNVFSNSPNVTTGTGLTGGNIEFWASDYTQANGANVPNASATTYDFGDTRSSNAGYGSFQIHNHSVTATTGQTVIAYNHWGNGGATVSDIGIGNRATADPDYTFAANANTYTVKRLQVLVHTAGNTPFTDPATVTPQAAGYKMVYGVQLPRAGGTQLTGTPYQVDRPEAITNPIARVGYYLELHKKTDPAGQNQYVFVSMDAFTQNLKQIGVPSTDTGALFQQNVTNLSVASNVTGVITGTSLGSGNIEFWPSNYAAAKAAASPPNASDTTLDFGDSGAGTGSGYGSFQIHNFGAAQTILAYNNWGSGGGDADLGIGNATSGSNPDWTFLHNAFNDYDIRNLEVLVLEVPEPSSLGLLAVGGLALLRRRRRHTAA